MTTVEKVFITVENETRSKKAIFALDIDDDSMQVELKFEPEAKVKENELYANVAMTILKMLNT